MFYEAESWNKLSRISCTSPRNTQVQERLCSKRREQDPLQCHFLVFCFIFKPTRAVCSGRSQVLHEKLRMKTRLLSPRKHPLNVSVRGFLSPNNSPVTPKSVCRCWVMSYSPRNLEETEKWKMCCSNVFRVTDWIRTVQKRHSCFFHLQAFLTGDVHFCEIQGHGQ